MKKPKLFLFLYTSLITLLLTGCYHPIKKYLVNLEQYPNLVITNWDILESQDEIKKYLKDQYTLYSAYNVKKIIFQEITTSNYQRIIIEIFQTKSKMDAMNLYRRYSSINQVTIGDAGSESSGFLAFYRGEFFVKIYIKGYLKNSNEIIRELAKQIDIKLKLR
ncbi:MAG: hypothetical protein H0Z30_04425 [Candidatus Marinimicrobia bacterium]|nr:hypothetical protein [Candidatus Neomarinimicrobiota bacterium]MCD6099114.1 hypothetical protein [Candidatus Neomarinimicrobiota bacterium]